MNQLVNVLVTGVLATTCLTACGDTGTQTVDSQTYTDPAYGYSFEYQEPFTLNLAAQLSVTAGGHTVSSASVVSGLHAPGKPATGFNVSVYDLNDSATVAQSGDAATSIRQDVLSKLSKKMDDVNFEKPASTTVSGRPALSTQTEFTLDKGE